MGRSVAQFFLRGMTPEWVLVRAQAFAASEGMRVEPISPSQVVLKSGSIWWTGERVIAVGAWSAEGGANVQVEAWAKGFTDMSADPSAVVGLIPRRDVWRIVATFVSQLGVSPEAVFRHG